MSIIKRGLIGILGSGLCLFSGLGIASPDSDTMVSSRSLPLMDCVINPSEVVDLGTAVAGKVVSIHADRSDRVSQAQVLVELESSVEQAALALASNRAALSTSITLRQEVAAFDALTRKRNEELLRTAAISQHDADRVRSEARITALQVQQERDNRVLAQLEQQRAEAVLALRTIRSPVNGVVMERFKSVGEFVDDAPLLRIARLDPLHIEVIIPVEYMGQIRPGNQAEVQSVIAGSDPFIATVERVDAVADAASGTFGVRLSVKNPDYGIAAGLRCQLEFLPDITLPESTVSESVTLQSQLKPQAVVETVQPRCLRAGPFIEEGRAFQFANRLDTEGISYAVEQLSDKPSISYIVLSEPDTGDLAILRQRLQEAGVTNFAQIHRGAYRDRISFGIYNGRRSTQQRQQALEELGFTTEIRTRNRAEPRYWLKLMTRDGHAGMERLRDELQQSDASLQLYPEHCLPSVVAHQEAQ